ncbi:MerR family transcriptional regulator [Streptomyces sp. NPDC050610]|uniref:MerR family transcriptional regulator n=1 Tax=Streptomyces sp. NPDC050610 TaxID=3157097 RepID=UPI00344655A6
MRIGELAARTGVSVRSLRYYEEQQLLTSVRSGGGHRHYVEADVDRVHYIQGLYAANLSSRTIAALMPCAESPSTHNSDAALERMALERDKLTTRIDGLQRARDTLDRMVDVARTHRETLTHAGAAPVAEGAGFRCSH